MTNQKREIFDRYQFEVSDIAGTFIVIDKDKIPTNYTRVYTVVAVNSGSRAPSKIRFGLQHGARNHWYEEEAAPVQNVYYTTVSEYHTRMTVRGVVALHDLQVGDLVVINWHGYDRKMES